MDKVQAFIGYLQFTSGSLGETRPKKVRVCASALSPELKKLLGIEGDRRASNFLGINIEVRPDFEVAE